SLEFAALMHDVGKLGIPEKILNKPAKLSDEEWDIMKTHPKLGVNILKPLGSFSEILPWIEYHHERLSGKGYYGIPDSQIPYAAKIIAVADTYAAITMRRSYKPPRAHEEAIKIMKEVSGEQLDQDLVEIFCNIPKIDLLEAVPETVEV
ncbi:MAG: HD domain-containing protein, partial [Lachnospiraceae bacterium]|nr:HD domain-containing protein [Lachnospiraceae bacterium]